MIFIISYLFLLIFYLLFMNTKISYAFAFAMFTPTFLSFTKKFLERYQRHNKISVQSTMDIQDLLEKIQLGKILNYKKIQLTNDKIIIETSPSLLSIGEVITIKKINHTFFIESQYPSYMEYMIPDTGIHLQNVKKIKKLLY